MNDLIQSADRLTQIYYLLLDTFQSGVLAYVVFETIRQEYRKNPSGVDDIFIGTTVISAYHMVILALANTIKPNSSSINLSYLFNLIAQSKPTLGERTYSKVILFIDEFKKELGNISHTIDRVIELRDKSVAHLDRKLANNPLYFLEQPPIKWDELEFCYDLVGSGLQKIGKDLGLNNNFPSFSVIANSVLAEKTRLVYRILSGDN